MRIYTRSGDDGRTTDHSGRSVSKNSPFCHAAGSLDELNCLLGLCASLCSTAEHQSIGETIGRIQRQLFCLGAALAGSGEGFGESAVVELEKAIDDADAKMPDLTSFIIPGGCELACHLHQARAVCRRAERDIVLIAESKGSVSAGILQYINRLGDLLFVLARLVNHNTGASEATWKP